MSGDTGVSGSIKNTQAEPIVRAAPATIYDVARIAGVATSTVSRALSNPGRVSFKTAEHVRKVAEEIGYRSAALERALPVQRTMMLAMIVADINNPVFHGMIRGAERTAMHAGYIMLLVETQESEHTEKQALSRVLSAVDGVILSSSRMPDSSIRDAAKHRPLVVLNRIVSQIPSVAGDNLNAMRKASEHLAGAGVGEITYLAGPETSWSDGMRWRGVRAAGQELDLKVRRIGPNVPTMAGGGLAATKWLGNQTRGVIAYNDLLAIGFIQAVMLAGCRVPEDVCVIGFDNILDSSLVEPRLTTIAAPLVSLGSAAVNRLLKRSWHEQAELAEPVLLPTRLVVRDSTGRGGNQ
ncbi:MAG TPA: LacI family DNA-binding transcriptional regulator [Propionibacteriaceae bacterium]|nr:LacI family DNA-binding transcriptional regulator [Propionibacteriaceae bacterium]